MIVIVVEWPLLARRAWNMRPWRRSPLMRPGYRLQSLLRIVAVVAVVATVPVGVMVGKVVHDRVTRYGDHVAGGRVVGATVVSTAAAPAAGSPRFGLAAAVAGARPTAMATWTDDGRVCRAGIVVSDDVHDGDRVPLDVGSDCAVVSSYRHYAVAAAILAALGVVAAGAAVTASGLAALRLVLDRRRAACWESEWATQGYR